ncbi:unnamed protein product [Arctogadus glacialis]
MPEPSLPRERHGWFPQAAPGPMPSRTLGDTRDPPGPLTGPSPGSGGHQRPPRAAHGSVPWLWGTPETPPAARVRPLALGDTRDPQAAPGSVPWLWGTPETPRPLPGPSPGSGGHQRPPGRSPVRPLALGDTRDPPSGPGPSPGSGGHQRPPQRSGSVPWLWGTPETPQGRSRVRPLALGDTRDPQAAPRSVPWLWGTPETPPAAPGPSPGSGPTLHTSPRPRAPRSSPVSEPLCVAVALLLSPGVHLL